MGNIYQQTLQNIPAMTSSEAKKENWKGILPEVRKDIETFGLDSNDPEHFDALVAKCYWNEMKGNKGVILSGVTGCGKTRRMRFICDVCEIRMVHVQDIVTTYLDGNEDNLTALLNLEPILGDSWWHMGDLAIDDLGTEEMSYNRYGTSLDVLRNVIERRYRVYPHWRTYFTTNLTGDALKARYGARVWSRLNEMCAFISLLHGDRRLGE